MSLPDSTFERDALGPSAWSTTAGLPMAFARRVRTLATGFEASPHDRQDHQGPSGRGLIRYLFGPGKANEHTDQRVITSGIVMGVEEGRTLEPAEIADLGAALDAPTTPIGTNRRWTHLAPVAVAPCR